jgi:hypothetical protein
MPSQFRLEMILALVTAVAITLLLFCVGVPCPRYPTTEDSTWHINHLMNGKNREILPNKLSHHAFAHSTAPLETPTGGNTFLWAMSNHCYCNIGLDSGDTNVIKRQSSSMTLLPAGMISITGGRFIPLNITLSSLPSSVSSSEFLFLRHSEEKE